MPSFVGCLPATRTFSSKLRHIDETTKPFLNRDSGNGKDPMAKSMTPNERIKRAYIDFLRQAMG
ncbi:MAG: hypothetical protein ACR2KT_11385, partial [Methylocella sp.]